MSLGAVWTLPHSPHVKSLHGHPSYVSFMVAIGAHLPRSACPYASDRVPQVAGNMGRQHRIFTS
jgi:hypothetical protein